MAEPSNESAPVSLAPPTLTAREQAVLGVVLDLYLRSGEPVASRHVAEAGMDLGAEHLSSASIRNVFAALEASGYLFQPHTSAGRIPTLEALRQHVRHLPAPEPLAAAEEARLQALLGGGDAPGDAELSEEARLERACQFLSEVSRRIGLVAIAPWDDPGLREIRFFRLSGHRVLAVLAASDRQVRERVARVPEDYSQEELDTAARFLNASFSGWTLERIRRELIRRVDEDRAAYDRLLQRVLVLYHCGVLGLRDTGQVFVEGASHLVSLLRDHDRLAEILGALAAKERLLALVQQIEPRGESEPASPFGRSGGWAAAVRIQVGLEEAGMADFGLVAADYSTPEHRQGTLAILGPAYMEYGRAAAAVLRVRQLLEQQSPPSLASSLSRDN